MKSIFKSRTFWVNVIAIVGIVANELWGIDLDGETQAAFVVTVLAIVNIALRGITSQPVK